VTPPRRSPRLNAHSNGSSVEDVATGHASADATTEDDAKLTWVFQPSVTPPPTLTSKPQQQQQPMSLANTAMFGSGITAPPLPRPVTTSLLPTYKILLIGDAAVGKSNLLLRFANNSFDIATRSTIGVEFVSRELELPTERDGGNERVNVQLWDTAGQERCGAISAAFFRGAKGIAVVYDCTRYPTLKNLPGWVAHAKQYADENCAFVVIGNKIDLKNLQAVSEEEAEGVAHSLGLRHFYASALTGEGVPSAFLHLILNVNSMMRSQHFASPKMNSASGGGRRSSSAYGNTGGSGNRVPVDISGFGNTDDAKGSQGRRGCCK
jgi:small GTP-binding protein